MTFTEDTFYSIWFIENCNGHSYRVLKNLREEYYIFYEEDIEEKSYTNYVVRKNFKEITTKLVFGDYFIEAEKNTLHSNIGAAVCCPCGLDIYKPATDVVHYMLKGKIIPEKEWMKVMKESEYWPEIMVNMLGKRIQGDTFIN